MHDHLNVQLGKKADTDQHLVNEFPGDSFGTEAKISDSSLRLITPFSGDETNSEADLNTFLREIYQSISYISNAMTNRGLNTEYGKLHMFFGEREQPRENSGKIIQG